MIRKQLQFNINFNKITMQYPANLSQVTGFYKGVEFQFTDVTIKAFLYELNTWVKTSTQVELSELQSCRL